jgi:G patch domain-containing protein 1
LTADQRREILGEEELKGPPRSVFSFIPQKEQDKLQEFLENAAGNSKGAVPDVDEASAAAALRGFIPFGNDPAKQERYMRFLQIKAKLIQGDVKHPPVSHACKNHVSFIMH